MFGVALRTIIETNTPKNNVTNWKIFVFLSKRVQTVVTPASHTQIVFGPSCAHVENEWSMPMRIPKASLESLEISAQQIWTKKN